MNQQHKGDIIINGMGSSNGGDFRKVIINGKGSIKSNVKAEYLEINGFGTFEGVVEGGKLKISGNASLKDQVQVEECIIEGNAKIKGHVHAKNLKVAGNATIEGNVKGDNINIEGRTKIGGQCTAETFYVQGPVRIDGELNAEEITIEPMFKCEIAEIGCRSIQVKYYKNSFWDLFQSILPTTFITNTIEGDEINLEYTKAKVVRGNNVTIGENCEIDLVEYTGTFHKDPSAKINESRKI